MIELILVLVLIAFVVVDKWLARERELKLWNVISSINPQIKHEASKPEPEIDTELADNYMTAEQRDELLKKELGDDTYQQLVSEQNYGRV